MSLNPIKPKMAKQKYQDKGKPQTYQDISTIPTPTCVKCLSKFKTLMHGQGNSV